MIARFYHVKLAIKLDRDITLVKDKRLTPMNTTAAIFGALTVFSIFIVGNFPVKQNLF